MGPIEHRVSKPGDWPERVAPLARALSHSFPAWVAAGPYPADSALAKRSLSILRQQVECHPSAIPSEHIEFADPDLQQQLAVMFDFTLSISTLVHAQVNCTRALWLLFATTVWRSVSHDLSIHREVGFVKPRQPADHPLSEGDFEGNATLVLSHVVMPVAASPSNDSDMGTASVEIEDDSDEAISDGIGDDSDEATSDGIEDDSDKVTSDGIEDGSGKQASPIEVPFDAHILPGTGIRHFAELPVFVIVDPDNITALLSSVVYQRHVWGIDEPAIGLVLSESGQIGRIVFSWIDTSGANDPPLVHFATAADDCQVGSPLGIFDLSKPLDAFAFAQFVFQLRNHHRVIAEASIPAACGCTSFSWRSDQVVGNLGQTVGQNDDFCGEFGETACMGEDDSNSATSKRADNELTRDSPISNWLMEHNVITLSRIKVPDLAKSNGMIDLYDTITKEARVPNLHKSCNLPNMPINLATIQTNILNSVRSDMAKLPEELANAMTSHFLYVLLAAEDGRARDTTSLRHGADEADCRHIWDTLLIWFTSSLSPRGNNRIYDIYFERTLNAPRNPAADGPRSRSALYDSLYDWTCRNKLFATKMHLVALSDESPPHLRAQTSPVCLQAASMYSNLEDRKVGEDFLQTVERHMRKQPSRGVCDAIFAAAVPELLKDDPADDTAFTRLLKQIPLVHSLAGPSEKLWDSPDYYRKGHVAELLLKQRERGVPGQGGAQVSEQPLAEGPKSTQAESLAVPKDTKSGKGEMQILPDSFISFHPPAPNEPNEPKVEVTRGTHNDLFLPILVVGYERSHSAQYQAMNQCRSYLVSSLCFLRALGLGDEPVFGLVVNGLRGIVTMGWQDDKGIYIMERNCRSYDLTDSMSVFQFAVVLLRLAERRVALENKFKGKRGGLVEALKLKHGPEYESLKWSKEAQLSGPETGATAEIQA